MDEIMTNKTSIINSLPSADSEKVDRALTFAERGQIRAAEKIVQNLNRKYSDNLFVVYAEAIIYALKDKHDEAIALFKKVINVYPDFSEAWFNMGVSHKKKFEFGKMIRAFQKAIELGNIADEHVNTAVSFLRGLAEQINKESGISLTDFLKAEDKFSEAFNLMKKGKWESAISIFKESLKINQKVPQPYGNMGICLAKLGRNQEALAALNKAIELNQDYLPAIKNREIISRLVEGERLEITVDETDYYKDIYNQEKLDT